MDLHHKIMYSTVATAIDRAAFHITKDPQRGIRSLADMGLQFAKGKNQTDFFKTAQKTIQNPHNPYNRLLTQVVQQVDLPIIKTFGANMGYVALSYGSAILRQNEKKYKTHLPWVVYEDLTSDQQGEHRGMPAAAMVRQANELGIYCFVLRTGKEQRALEQAVALANVNTYSAFFLIADASIITSHMAASIKKAKNIAVLVPMDTSEQTDPVVHRTMLTMKEQHLLYGYLATYKQEEPSTLLADGFLTQRQEEGCTCGVYLDRCWPADDNEKSPLYRAICEARGPSGKPIVLFDWFHDTQYVGDLISKGSSPLYLENDGRIHHADGRCVEYLGQSLALAIQQLESR